MTTTTHSTPLSTVIGVFSDYKQANKAIDELRTANFRYERIRLVEHGTGSFRDTLKGMFSGQAAVASNTSESLVNMGMPEYEAEYYQRELDADHVLLLMNADDRPEDAFKVMRENGAFDINSRLRTTDLSAADEDVADEAMTPSTMSGRNGASTAFHSARATDANVSANAVDQETSMDSTDPNAPVVDPNAPVYKTDPNAPVVDPNAPVYANNSNTSMDSTDPNAPVADSEASDDMTDSAAFTNTTTADSAPRGQR